MATTKLIVLPNLYGLDIRNEQSLEAQREILLDLNEQIEGIQARADSEDRDLTDDEVKEIDGLFAQFEQVEGDIERRERINAQTARLREKITPQSEPTEPEPQNLPRNEPAPVRASGSHNPGRRIRIESAEPKGKWGWRHFGEFAQQVQRARNHGASIDPRLIQNAPTSYGSEGVGADGGFAVPPDFRDSIMEKIMAEDSLLSRTDQLTSSSNTLTFPKDEETPWGTGGMQAYWEGEGDQLTQSKPALKETSVKLNKLGALVPVTEELLEDAPALDSYLRRRVPQKMDAKINTSIISGTGAGMPEGILVSGSTIAVAKESGQAADTIVFNNIVKMWSRCYGPSRRNAVWLINQDIEPQLMTMSFEGTSSSVPAYMPAGGLSASPYATLMGRPVIPVEACSTLGDLGDIILADLSQYLTVTKTGGIRTDVSVHLYFDYDLSCFRFIIRLGGQSWFSSTISPQNGTATRSPFVALAERA